MNRLLRIVACLFPVMAPAESFAQSFGLQEIGSELSGDVEPATIYPALDVITMNPGMPRAEAFAVRDGKFIAVGSLEQVAAAAGPNAKLDTRLASKVVMAGFVEQHVHPVLAALTMNTHVISIEDWDAIDGFSASVRDEESYRDRLLSALVLHENHQEPFITWGYHHYFHGPMSREFLDQLAPSFPVVVWHRSCHEFFLNSKALELTGIDASVMEGLSESQREQASLAKGHFYEQGALAILGKLAPILASPEDFDRGLKFTERYYHRTGITVACEPGGLYSKPMQEAVNAVYSDNETPFNHLFIPDGKSLAAMHPNDPEEMIDATRDVLSWGKGRTRFLPRQVKLFSDGAIYSQLMQMRDGYLDGHHGAWIMDPPVFAKAFQAYWDAGYQIHIHNNGDGGLDVLLENLEKAMARRPREDHRTVLVHFGFADADQVKRWSELGGIVSSNPYYVTALAGRYSKLGIGPERSRNMVPMGDVVKHGTSFSFHSDMPMAPAKPLQLVWSGVNRLTAEGDVEGPEHCVSLDLALRAITIDAAYSIQQEKSIGSIEVGKDANVTILDQSPYEVHPRQLKDVTVWGTMLEGRVQPVAGSGAPKTGLRAPPNEVPDELQRIRRANALDLAMRNGQRLVPVECAPGCGCRLSSCLAELITQQIPNDR